MNSRFEHKKATLVFIFLVFIIWSPKICRSHEVQMDPNIPEIEGIDDYDETDVTTEAVEADVEKDFIMETEVPLLRTNRRLGNGPAVTPPLEDYLISTTLEPTPAVFFGGQLSFKQECTAYGDAIDLVQTGFETVEEKKKKLSGENTVSYFGTKICNWSRARLECIPNEHRVPVTTSSPTGGTGTAPEVKKNLPGSCQCMRALGEKAKWIEDTKDVKKSKCYIPADFGMHSECGHDINLPYGEIDEIVKSRKFVAAAATMCVPNSQCITGYQYVGLRCHCKKGTKLNKKQGTCSRGHRLTLKWASIMVVINNIVPAFVWRLYPSILT